MTRIHEAPSCHLPGSLDRSEHQCRVDTFLTGVGHELPENPTLASRDKLLLYARLLFEEAHEYLEAAGVVIKPKPEYVPNTPLHYNDLSFEAVGDGVLDDIADALGDVIVIATGGLSINGISDVTLMEEIDNNNLLKLAKGHKDPMTGKFIKPKDHPPPRISKVIDEQGRSENDK